MVGLCALTLAVLVCLLASRLPAQGQACAEPRYRWSEKVDTSLADLPPLPTSITAILSGWEPPALTARDRCAARAGRERQVYGLAGWVRRIEKHKDDGDWHLELTERRDSPPGSCIVAEIPLSRLSARYARARADLDAFLGGRRIDRDGDLAEPVRVRFIGAAFFDGQHRAGPRRLERTDGTHGRCNASARALWELHPIYRVERP